MNERITLYDVKCGSCDSTAKIEVSFELLAKLNRHDKTHGTATAQGYVNTLNISAINKHANGNPNCVDPDLQVEYKRKA